MDAQPDTRATRLTLAALVFIPIVFNAIELIPELRAVPNLNDDAFHFLFVHQASAALASGANPFDFWLPQLELGIPQFFYYQHLPHLVVVAVYWLLLKQIDLLTLFNLARYLMMVCFPITVYWSMRRMDFSPIAAAVGAACSSLIAADYRYGFEYQTYTWRGQGMFSQLAAMHLLVASVASLYRTIEHGKGCATAIVVASALVLSNILNATIMAVSVGVILTLIIAWEPARWRMRVTRLAAVAIPAGIITAYMWLPFFLQQKYLDVSPYLQIDPYKSYGAAQILSWIVSGDLFDHERLAALTGLMAIGIAAVIRKTTRDGQVAIALFVTSLCFYFGRETWGGLIDLIPMHRLLIFNRFIGGVDFGAILLMGIGGEWLWRWFARIRDPLRSIAPAVLILAILLPALQERDTYYKLNTVWLEQTRSAVATDSDLKTILDTLAQQPPGRTFGGMRKDWGRDLSWGYVHFFDLMASYAIEAFGPPYQALTFNGDVIWYVNDQRPADYRLFNIRYVVAPSKKEMPPFLTPIKKTERYTLYRADSGGYGELAASVAPRTANSQAALLSQNLDWLRGNDPVAGNFFIYNFEGSGPAEPIPTGSLGKGTVTDKSIAPGEIELNVQADAPGVLILKTTYHPNWHVSVDGIEQPTMMASPSLLAVRVPAGTHIVRAEYRSSWLKKILLIISLTALAAVALFKRELDALMGGTTAEAAPEAVPPAAPVPARPRKASGRK